MSLHDAALRDASVDYLYDTASMQIYYFDDGTQNDRPFGAEEH